MNDLIQGEIVLLLGPDPAHTTDYSCDFSEFVINEARTLVAKSPSFGSPELEQKAAAGTAQVTATFLAVPHASSGLWFELRRASRTRTGELYFDVKYSTAATSASNPRRTGYIVVSDIDMGAGAYQVRRQTKVFPARAVSDPITS